VGPQRGDGRAELVYAGESRYGKGERTLCLSVKIKIKLNGRERSGTSDRIVLEGTRI